MIHCTSEYTLLLTNIVKIGWEGPTQSLQPKGNCLLKCELLYYNEVYGRWPFCNAFLDNRFPDNVSHTYATPSHNLHSAFDRHLSFSFITSFHSGLQDFFLTSASLWFSLPSATDSPLSPSSKDPSVYRSKFNASWLIRYHLIIYHRLFSFYDQINPNPFPP